MVNKLKKPPHKSCLPENLLCLSPPHCVNLEIKSQKLIKHKNLFAPSANILEIVLSI